LLAGALACIQGRGETRGSVELGDAAQSSAATAEIVIETRDDGELGIAVVEWER
jgi:hypothetical protein